MRPAIQKAYETNARVAVTGARSSHSGHWRAFDIEVLPVPDHRDLLLVCFIDAPTPERAGNPGVAPAEMRLAAEPRQELDATRGDPADAPRDPRMSSEEQTAINEEAHSANEEYQTANAEPLTSKAESQALNEELTALNARLRETIERHRSTADDLRNVLYNTDVATIFLDEQFRVRFFTPSIKSLFRIAQGDIGRPLSDFSSSTNDDSLLEDCAKVVLSPEPREREIQALDGTWYLRRILPYRIQGEGAEGVVVTYVDVTERRRAADSLAAAKRQAELANAAKSRFLAAASHDLRQPLQSLLLLQSVLASAVAGERASNLLARMDTALHAMAGTLNALLDINQIEAGVVHTNISSFPVNELLERMRGEFAGVITAKEIALRVVPCGLRITTDPLLLAQMLRNLLANAVRYTPRGKILLGCRRRGPMLRIEVLDTGVGIPSAELNAIFEDYHQYYNPSPERGGGLGLGLAIVQRLGVLLNHPIHVASIPGRGSRFAIDVEIADGPKAAPRERIVQPDPVTRTDESHRRGEIVLIEDDTEIRELLQLHLTRDGHRTTTATDAAEALDIVVRRHLRPDLILVDFNLPGGTNGLQLATTLREKLRKQIPTIVLSGDISTGTLRDITRMNCLYLHKPARLSDLLAAIQRLLAIQSMARGEPSGISTDAAVIFVVDDDSDVRESIRAVLEGDGKRVEVFASSEAFLSSYHPASEACLLIDAYLPGMDGLTLLRRLRDDHHRLPAIMITGNSDVTMAVEAMKAGATDFIEKPVGASELLASVALALEQSRDSSKTAAWRDAAASHLATLTPRQREIMRRVLAGELSKNIAADLGISQRTVENHRAAIMRRTGTKSLPALARLALANAPNGSEETA